MAGLNTGPVLGVAMLDTDFPRPPGDIGNPATFPFPVLLERVPGADVAAAVTDQPHDDALINAFVDAGKSLVRQGATLVATSCGFLAPLQVKLADALPVPVMTSALIVLPGLRQSAKNAGQPIGILTFDAGKLTARHLPSRYGPYAISGVENGQELFPTIRENRPRLNPDLARKDVADAAAHLHELAPYPAAIILECTNLPPYRDVVAARFDCPIIDIRDLILDRVAN